jgi:predicted RNA-binding Zn-ribbon protein involved in translation (DUF1610 family)
MNSGRNSESNSEGNSETIHNCPKCGTDNVRRTHRVGKLDRVLSLVNLYPYYCLECNLDTRFHQFGRK